MSTLKAAPHPIVRDIDAFMQASGVPNRGWYVGITSNVEARLFGDHNVHRKNNTWIYRTCSIESEARALEAAYHRVGCKGGTGGGSGDGTCKVIYAYVITPKTVE